MNKPSPKHAILLAGIAALVPGAALAADSSPPAEAAPAPAGRFTPPPSGMVLTREVRRPLLDGQEVVARRSYEIHFEREGSGYRVDGKLIAVEVDAPPNLAPLAELERRRTDTDTFPMHLDAQGMILDQAGGFDAATAGQASTIVGHWVAGSALAGSDQADVNSFVQQLTTQGGTVKWPRNLFRPAVGDHRESRAFALPQGGTGKVTVDLAADAERDSGLLRRVERTVTTDFGGSERITRELWRLEGMARQR
ncbi:MAG: hypothetical protein KGL44_05020 [Sphingomonadales bacterium]|nr:hypothetical protein [Sphingomonadales bacterium]